MRFAFALATGMRPEEYLGLQWKDVDLESETVTVRCALIWRAKGGGRYFGEPKTARSRLQIPLPASTLRALADRWQTKRLRAACWLPVTYCFN